MKPQVFKSEDGYSIRGIEPADIGRFPDDVKLMFWRWVVEIGLKQKDKDLAAGIDKNGKPLKPITAYTRKHRHSEMTPSGKGVPSAPPLTPGLQKSRTRSLLTGRAFVNHAEFWWKFDPYTGDSWATVLEYQAKEGRDVFGLSPRALRATRLYALGRYDDWKKGQAEKPKAKAEPFKITGGQRNTKKLDLMQPGASLAGNVGFRTEAEWRAYLRKSARTSITGRPNIPSPHRVVGPNFNKLLAILFGVDR